MSHPHHSFPRSSSHPLQGLATMPMTALRLVLHCRHSSAALLQTDLGFLRARARVLEHFVGTFVVFLLALSEALRASQTAVHSPPQFQHFPQQKMKLSAQKEADLSCSKSATLARQFKCWRQGRFLFICSWSQHESEVVMMHWPRVRERAYGFALECHPGSRAFPPRFPHDTYPRPLHLEPTNHSQDKETLKATQAVQCIKPPATEKFALGSLILTRSGDFSVWEGSPCGGTGTSSSIFRSISLS